MVFRQVQTARRHNTLCHVCCDWFLLIPSWRAKPGMSASGPKKGIPYMSWDLSIYRLQLPSLLFFNSCERRFYLVGAVFQAALALSDG